MANFGAKSENLRPIVPIPIYGNQDIGQKLAIMRPKLAKIGQKWPKMAKIGPNLVDFGAFSIKSEPRSGGGSVRSWSDPGIANLLIRDT